MVKSGKVQLAKLEFEEIVETFQYLEDWEDRYRYVIDLGRTMPKLESLFKTETNKVNGCASQVWLHSSVEEFDQVLRFSFEGESDALIVSGLISILRSLYNGLSAEEILAVDFDNEMDRLDLKEHLSLQRSNGLRSMVERIQEIAKISIRS